MATLTEGSLVGGCRVEWVIGRGGMGIVYGATQMALARRVALKVIAPEFAEDPEFRDRFQDEWRAAGGLEHPAVVPVYQAGEEDGVLYVVMRYVEGTDLRALIDREGALSPQRAVGIIGQVAGALDDAHRHSLIHRDVKPANILIASDRGRERAFLTDFGLTRHATSAVARRTNTGQWVGTPDYIAPEQIEDTPIDGRADVYALGCVLYETLTGALPFPQADLVPKVMARLQGSPPVPSAQRPELAPFDPVIAKALARLPEGRYTTTGELAREAGTASGRVGQGGGAAVPSPAAAVPPLPTQPPAPPPATPAPGPAAPPAAWPGHAGAPPAAPPFAAGGGYAESPPPAQPRRRSRVPVIAGLIGGVVLLIGALAVVAVLNSSDSGGGPTKTLSRLKVQRDVKAFVKRRLKLTMAATCPPAVPVRAGGTFNCTTTDSDKDLVTVRVRQVGDKGATTQSLVKAVYTSGYIENNARQFYLKQRSSGKIRYAIRSVRCPPKFEAKPGLKFSCPVVFDDGVREAFPVTITSAVGGRYRIGYRKANGDLR